MSERAETQDRHTFTPFIGVGMLVGAGIAAWLSRWVGMAAGAIPLAAAIVFDMGGQPFGPDKMPARNLVAGALGLGTVVGALAGGMIGAVIGAAWIVLWAVFYV